MVKPTVQRGEIKVTVWGVISFKIKTPLIFMLRDEENNNHGYTASSYISSLEDGLLSIYQTGQLSQQDNAHINTASIIQEWHEKHGIWVIDWP